MDAVRGTPAVQGQRLLFMAGAGRSGSTLMERVVGRLPGVVVLGEARYVWDRGVLANQRCGCGEDFADCPFWAQVGEQAFGGWSRETARDMVAWRQRRDRARRIPDLMWERRSPGSIPGAEDYALAYEQLYRAAADVAGVPWVTDSSKHVSMPYVLGLSSGLDLRVLQLVRDPRGVAYSWGKAVVRPEITDEVALMPQYRPSEVARTWVIHNAALAPLRALAVPILRVRYEDFVAAPLRVLRRVAAFMDLSVPSDLEAQLRGGGIELARDHSVAGNPMRFRSGRVALRSDDQWIGALPARDRRMITAMTTPLLQRYGYPSAVPGRETSDPA